MRSATCFVSDLTAPHRQSGEGPGFAVGPHRIRLLDEGDQVDEQILLKGGEGGRLLGNRIARGHILGGAAIGKHDDHRRRLLFGIQVVENLIGDAAARPFVFVAADPVQQVEHRILLILGIPGRRIDLRLPFGPDRRRVVLDGLELAPRDALAADVKAFCRRDELLGLNRGLLCCCNQIHPAEDCDGDNDRLYDGDSLYDGDRPCDDTRLFHGSLVGCLHHVLTFLRNAREGMASSAA